MRRDYQSRWVGKRVKMPLAAGHGRSWRSLVFLLVLVPAGCNTTNRGGQAKAQDPLFGVPPGPSATRAPTGTASAAPVPASSASNAALVNGPMTPPLYAPVGSAGQPTGWQPGNPGYPQPNYSPQPGYSATPNNSIPQLGYGSPPPNYNGNTPMPPAPVNLVPPGNPPLVPLQPGQRLASYDQAQAYLTSLGVKWQRLESGVDGDWKFTCSIPRRENPAISRTYEGRALNHLAAVQAVLDQINQDRP